MLNEMMGDHEKDYVIHWWEFECDEFDFYSVYEWQVNCLKCKQRLTQRAPDAAPQSPFLDRFTSAARVTQAVRQQEKIYVPIL